MEHSVFDHAVPLAVTFVSGSASVTVLSAAARALPDPLPNGSRFYLFFYRFANQLLINWDKAAKAKE